MQGDNDMRHIELLQLAGEAVHDAEGLKAAYRFKRKVTHIRERSDGAIDVNWTGERAARRYGYAFHWLMLQIAIERGADEIECHHLVKGRPRFVDVAFPTANALGASVH